MDRRITQIALAPDGSGQTATLMNDRVEGVGAFRYPVEALSTWRAGRFRSFADYYVDESFMFDGIEVEGSGALDTLFFVGERTIKIIDAEVVAKRVPSGLRALVSQIRQLAIDTERVETAENYVRVVPLGVAQSREVQDAGVEVVTNPHDFPESARQAQAKPLWLFPINREQRASLEKTFGLGRVADFIYLAHSSGQIVRLEVITSP